MPQKCYKCNKPVEQDQGTITCNDPECNHIYHRVCAHLMNNNVYEAVRNNNLLSFLCDRCMTMCLLVPRIDTIEDKVKKINNMLNSSNLRLLQQTNQQSNGHEANNVTNGATNTKNNNNDNNNINQNDYFVIGNNTNLHRLKVVCDYGRWVQVGKFATNTSEADIIDHLSRELHLNKTLIKCTKLVRNDADLASLQYCKFKISVPDFCFNDLFNESIWPCGAMVSYFTPRPQTHHRT